MALEYLQNRGLKILVRNYRVAGGEIDLIMREHKTVAFIEVRYRANNRFMNTIESIDPAKCARIIRTSQRYLQQHPLPAGNTCRFDVITITGNTPQPAIEWIKNAFQA